MTWPPITATPICPVCPFCGSDYVACLEPLTRDEGKPAMYQCRKCNKVWRTK